MEGLLSGAAVTLEIDLGSKGQVVVDKSQRFQWELGQWEDPDSFVQVS